ncbi:MAG: xylulokinase [Clostridia bacterium]|nr:xylulokinase [Clostridia bacterium]
MFYIGIDLGTSALKMLLVDEKGEIIRTASEEYPLFFPHNGWSEQNPEDWYSAAEKCLSQVLKGIDAYLVKGIGIGGQMHGLVVLDKNDNVIRPAILWNDGRTDKQVEYLNNVIGKDKLSQYTANIAFAGFTAPKIIWMKENEPEKFEKIEKIMLPKDYLVYRLTGEHTCDYSDASGMLLLDVKNKCWSEEMLEICGISKNQLPDLYESYDIVGKVKKEFADRFGLSDVSVAAGAGDNAAAAVGTGTVGEGKCNISLGTSGTIFISSERFGDDRNNALHSFAHADGNFHLMGCMLSAASCNKWFMDDILNDENYQGIQSRISDEKLGRNNIYFLPYLMGERSPINDVDARGTFIGLTMNSKREDMLQAVFEGVAFAIRDSFEKAKELGIKIEASNICGGGAKSALWQKIMANVLGIRLDTVKTEQGPGYGAAILAMVGCGAYGSVSEACAELVEISSSVYPDAELSAMYDEKYKNFSKVYPALKNVFKEIKEEIK